MINYPKKPSPSLLILIGIPAGIFFSIFSFLQIGFNFQDFKNNLSNRYLVTDPLFNPKWAWAWENSSDALIETIQIAPSKTKARNWGFDVTPAKLISGLISERGICEANEKSILSLFPERA